MIEHFHMQICTALHSTAQHCTALLYCRAHSHNDWGSNLARTNRTSESCRNWAKACGSFKPYRALGQIQWLHTRKSFKEKIKKQLLSIANITAHILMLTWLLIKIPLSRNGHSSRIKILLSRNFRELHVYLSRGPCWPTTPLMKIRSPPAKLRQRITDHFLVAF